MFDASANTKLDELLKLTREINKIITGEVHTPSQTNESSKVKSFASVLKEIHVNTDKTHKTIEDMKSNSLMTPMIPRKISNNLHVPSVKRRRIDDLVSPIIKPSSSTKTTQNKTNTIRKTSNKNEQSFKTGTGTCSDLGIAVQVNKKSTESKPKLPFSIYVSRFNPNVTYNNIVNHIKKEIPDVDSKDFVVHTLTKKNIDISSLTFVSFRIICTQLLYDRLIQTDFWPTGILIGEFCERRLSKQNTVGDFMPNINISSTTNISNQKNLATTSTASTKTTTTSDLVDLTTTPTCQ